MRTVFLAKFFGLFLLAIVLVSGCIVTQEDVPKIVNQMEEAYAKINTLQYEENSISARDDTAGTRKIFIDKFGQKMKSISSQTGENSNIIQLWAGNEYYNVQDYSEDEFDAIYRTTCGFPVYTLTETDLLSGTSNAARKFSPVKILGKETINGQEAIKLSLGGKTVPQIW